MIKVNMLWTIQLWTVRYIYRSTKHIVGPLFTLPFLWGQKVIHSFKISRLHLLCQEWWHAYNHSTQAVKAGLAAVQGHPWLHSQFEVRLVSMKSCFPKPKIESNLFPCVCFAYYFNYFDLVIDLFFLNLHLAPLHHYSNLRSEFVFRI